MKKRFLLAGLVLGGSLAASSNNIDGKHIHRGHQGCERRFASHQGGATGPGEMTVVKAPDLVRTGPNSRAELTAPDQTITRIGANAVFSFEHRRPEHGPAARQHSIPFPVPARAAAPYAAGARRRRCWARRLSTSPRSNGGFKIIVLEGKGKATLPNGKTVRLKEGQLVFVLPGQNDFGPLLDINLEKLVAGSLLVNGFSTPLSSQTLINEAISRQKKKLAHGGAEDTGVTRGFIRRGQRRG